MVFKAGDVLYQDNVADHPADKQPQHFSGTRDEECAQMIVQLRREPEYDNPCPF